LEKPAGFIEEF